MIKCVYKIGEQLESFSICFVGRSILNRAFLAFIILCVDNLKSGILLLHSPQKINEDRLKKRSNRNLDGK